MPNFAENNQGFMGLFPENQEAIAEPKNAAPNNAESTPQPVEQKPDESQVASEKETVETPTEAVLPIRKRGRKKKDAADSGATNEAGHFSCLCDSTMIAKVRAIAWKEHMTVRAVVESMFSKCIAKYEKKNGPVQIDQVRPSDDLF